MIYVPAPGDFCVVRMPGLVGTAIRFGQWINGDGFADYEHAAVLADCCTVVEAMPDGARMADLSRFGSEPIRWYRAPDAARTKIVAAALLMIGTPYSFLDYLALAEVRVHSPFAPAVRRYVASTKHMICSQLVDEAYRRAGVQLFDDGRDPGDVTPADLLGLIVAQGA